MCDVQDWWCVQKTIKLGPLQVRRAYYANISHLMMEMSMEMVEDVIMWYIYIIERMNVQLQCYIATCIYLMVASQTITIYINNDRKKLKHRKTIVRCTLYVQRTNECDRPQHAK